MKSRTRSREIKRRAGIGTSRAKRLVLPQIDLPRLPRFRLPRMGRGAVKLPLIRGVKLSRVKEVFLQVCVAAVVVLIAGAAFGLLRPGVRVCVDAETVAAFRVPHRAIGMLRTYAVRNGISFPQLFAVFNAENGFFPEKHAVYDLSMIHELYIQDFNRLLRQYNSRSLAPYAAMFESLFSEIEVFPIPAGWYEDEAGVMFGDSWGVQHNFQGNRMHMGTAIIDRMNIRGRVPVVSMTHGTVREAGWDNNLGYFVSVTTENDTLYLYAHLDSIAAGLAAGQNITAGQHIGQMGNTGGGRSGQSFPVHLHVAISPNAGFTRGDFWINPYPLLRYIENPTGI
jgi:hypothetical protein